MDNEFTQHATWIYRTAAALLMITVIGCISPSTEQAFRTMETSATAPLEGVDSLPRYAPDTEPPAVFQDETQFTNLTVDAAVRIALRNNRRMQAAYDRLDIAAANRLASRLIKNPEAEASLITSQEDSSENVLELGAEIDLLQFFLLPKHRAIGSAEYSATRMDIARSVQRLAYDTRVAYFRLLAAQQRLVMRESVADAAAAASEMASRLREAGNIKRLDKLNWDAQHQRAVLAVSAARLAVTEARERLNVLMGLSGGHTMWKTQHHLPAPGDREPEDSAATVTRALDNSVQLAVMRERIQVAAQQLGLARTTSVIPALHIGVLAEREPSDVWLVGPMLSVELPLFDVGQAERPAAKAALRKLHHDYAALAIDIGSAARTARERVTVAREHLDRYTDELIPVQRDITHRTQLQYNAMQLGVFQLLQAKQTEIATESAYIDELLNYWMARIDLEQIRNGLLVKASSTATSATMDTPMAGGGNGGH